jgi:hypothetical protein
MRRGIAAALAGASIVVAAGRALAGSPTTNCLVAKHKAAGRKIKNRMNCIARAVARFVPVEPDCVTRAEARFDASFARADEKGPCPGTAANVESLADDTRDRFPLAVPLRIDLPQGRGEGRGV